MEFFRTDKTTLTANSLASYYRNFTGEFPRSKLHAAFPDYWNGIDAICDILNCDTSGIRDFEYDEMSDYFSEFVSEVRSFYTDILCVKKILSQETRNFDIEKEVTSVVNAFLSENSLEGVMRSILAGNNYFNNLHRDYTQFKNQRLFERIRNIGLNW